MPKTDKICPIFLAALPARWRGRRAAVRGAAIFGAQLAAVVRFGGFQRGAMPPAAAETFYNRFMEKLRAATTLKVAEGRFAAMMDVELVNDGPVTILLDSQRTF